MATSSSLQLAATLHQVGLKQFLNRLLPNQLAIDLLETVLVVQLADRIARLADIEVFALSAVIPDVGDRLSPTAVTFVVLEHIVHLFLTCLR